MNPSCSSGTSPVNGSTAANCTKWSGADGLRTSMIHSLFAARVPSANTRAASAGGR